MVLDETVFEKFYKEVLNEYGHSFPILPGIRVPSSSKQLKRMKDKFGIRVSKKLMKEMIAAEEAGKNPKEIGIRWAVEFTQFVRKLGIRGVHFFIMNDVESAILVKKRLSF
ncbi:MAG: hypothetical protein D6767_01435 [Candidatus Hydrogenedentota bacterium]|nr:MAG: hypothetical protein D6767_01435 [Candidatus Hydrogenedentota bacterium]